MNYIRHLNAFFSLVRNDERLACSHVSLYLALFQYWNFNRFQNPFPVYRTNLMQLSKIGSKNTYHKCLKELHRTGYIHCFPPVNRFKPVTISMPRLDLRDEQSNQHQLDMFNSAETDCHPERSEGPPVFNADPVPQLTITSPKSDTPPIPKSVRNIKDKQFLKESNTPSPGFSNNNQMQKHKSVAADSQYVNDCHPACPATSGEPVEGFRIEQIQSFFTQNNYPCHEALKFFNHYQSIGWKIKGITPITNWQASANKWMLNAIKFQTSDEQAVILSAAKDLNPQPVTINNTTIQQLFSLHLAGQNIFKHLTTDHFTHLNLSINGQILTEAWHRRTNQLMGSNNYSVNQLLQAYQSSNPDHPLCKSDHPNLLQLAQRVAVLHHFKQLQHDGHKNLPP